MKILELVRVAESPLDGTFGVLLDDTGLPFCVTLEDPWMDNERGISCIPEGVYVCEPHNGDRFTDVWELTNVPGRDAILIHAGNTNDDVQGCILVASFYGTLNDKRAILRSRDALNALQNYIGVNHSFVLQVTRA